MSGTGTDDASIENVLTPGIVTAGNAFAHAKSKTISVAANESVEVKPNAKLCESSISTGVSGIPVNALVDGSVV